MNLSVLSFEVVDDVAIVTMNHPPANALGRRFLADFENIIERLREPGQALAITPEQAAEISLVNGVVAKEKLYEHSLEYARRLARQATGAIARIKACISVGLREGRERGMAEETRAFRENIITNDAREGVAAFLDGRKPEFKG